MDPPLLDEASPFLQSRYPSLTVRSEALFMGPLGSLARCILVIEDHCVDCRVDGKPGSTASERFFPGIGPAVVLQKILGNSLKKESNLEKGCSVHSRVV